MKKEWTTFCVIVLLCFWVVVLAPFIGPEIISWRDILFGGADETTKRIFWMIRLPRVLLAFVAGAGLAASGTCFQAMFRNPLATPFTLGISSGAAFGAAIYVWLDVSFSLGGVSGASVFALLGALGTVALVYGLTQVGTGFSTSTLLLAGVAVNFFFSSLIMFIQYISDESHSMEIVRWLMGNVQAVGEREVLSVAPFVLAGGSVILWMTNELNLLLTGEDLATSRGANVPNLKRLLFFGTSLMIGGVVAFCGPIGFVGMMCPHMCRALVGADHRRLVPVSFVFGGAFLVACDTAARTAIAPAEIPVGVITALLGGPFFLVLLLRRSRALAF